MIKPVSRRLFTYQFAAALGIPSALLAKSTPAAAKPTPKPTRPRRVKLYKPEALARYTPRNSSRGETVIVTRISNGVIHYYSDTYTEGFSTPLNAFCQAFRPAAKAA